IHAVRAIAKSINSIERATRAPLGHRWRRLPPRARRWLRRSLEAAASTDDDTRENDEKAHSCLSNLADERGPAERPRRTGRPDQRPSSSMTDPDARVCLVTARHRWRAHNGRHSARRGRSRNPRPAKIAGIAFSIRAVRVAGCLAPAKW